MKTCNFSSCLLYLYLQIKLDNLPIKDMTKCCDDHDICYGTCGTNKDSCDLEFKRCLYRICDNKLGKIAEPLGESHVW